MIIQYPDRPPEEIQPERQFRGAMAHPDLFVLHERGEITDAEFILTLHIEALVTSFGLGCWASNRKLAEVMRCRPDSISRMIRHLQESEIIIIYRNVYRGGRYYDRLMETSWSRITRGGPISEGKPRPISRRTKPSVHNSGVDPRAKGGPGPRVKSTQETKHPIKSGENKGEMPDSESRKNSAIVLHKKKEKRTQASFPEPARCRSPLRTSSPVLVVNELTVGSTSQSKEINMSPRPTLNNLPPPKLQQGVLPHHVEWSKRLREGLRDKNISVTNQRAVMSWAKQFRILEEVVPTARIQAALDWYVGKIGGDMVPECYCGATFRKKFAKVESAMRKDGGPLIPLTPEAEKVCADALKNYRWPKGTEQYVPKLVASSWSNLSAMYAKIKKWQESAPDDQLSRFVKRIMGYGGIGSITSFLRDWIKHHQQRLMAWSEYDGGKSFFMSGTFSVGHQRFQAMGMQWSIQYSNTSKLWQQFNRDVLQT